jgi:hypothetical protein
MIKPRNQKPHARARESHIEQKHLAEVKIKKVA